MIESVDEIVCVDCDGEGTPNGEICRKCFGTGGNLELMRGQGHDIKQPKIMEILDLN